MINSLIKHENKTNNKLSVGNILNEVYLVPQWEKIKSFSISENVFFFYKRNLKLNLYRKFSFKNQLEKYSIRTEDEKVLALMDLKIYKDSVYIIDLNITSKLNFDKILEKIIQVSVEKALYNTTEKEIVINLTSGLVTKHKIKKFLLNNEFTVEENQSNYEKELFGETYTLKLANNSKWMKRIKQFNFLNNK